MWKKILQKCLIVTCLLNFTSDASTELETLPVTTLRKEYLRQVAIPSDPLGLIAQRIPCICDKGVCKCCLGEALSIFRMKGCMEIVYMPEDFAFEVRMKMNDMVLYKSKVSGKNPPPICVTPPRFGFAKVCVQLYDVYFFGRNMHVCVDVGGFVQGFELFSRSFDCLRFGAQGVRIVKPEVGYPFRPNDEIDDDNEEIEDYDENVVRKASTESSDDSSDEEDEDDDDDDDDDDSDSDDRK